jgi:hypothetical protein
MKEKPSDIFEGPGSSLHRMWEQSVKAEMLMFNQFFNSAERVGFNEDQAAFLWHWIEAISKKDL